MPFKVAALCLLVLSIACGDDDAPGDDAGVDAFVATDAAADSQGGVDAFEAPDVGMDAGADANIPDASEGDVRDAMPDVPPRAISLLVFTRTEGFRHRSIEPGVAAFREIAAARGWSVEATEDPRSFSAAGLADVHVVVFLNTSGDILDGGQQDALEAWVMSGGGWLGIHAASDTEYEWPWYGQLLGGAWFERHPATQTATLNVENRTHPATAHLAAAWMRRDEWYDFRTNPRAEVDVLITIDESSYEGGGDGPDHPMTWTREMGLGRSFYTALGHTSESYGEPEFRTLLAEAAYWAAGF